MDLTDEELDPVLDVIGNKLAVGVNQAWAGHPGSLVRTSRPTSASAGTSAESRHLRDGREMRSRRLVSDGVENRPRHVYDHERWAVPRLQGEPQ